MSYDQGPVVSCENILGEGPQEGLPRDCDIPVCVRVRKHTHTHFLPPSLFLSLSPFLLSSLPPSLQKVEP